MISAKAKISCMVVEDEPLAQEILQDYISQIRHLHLKATVSTVSDALEVLRSCKIDLIFLDLHLPGTKGFQFLRSLQHRPDVIVTTAHHEYAVESYELNVKDYLLKPIDFERFLSAINKIDADHLLIDEKEEESITVKVGYNFVQMSVSDICWVESQRDYVTVHTRVDSIKFKSTLSGFLARLSEIRFLRVHKSFAVAVEYITSYGARSVSIGETTLPIGRNYLEAVRRRLSKR